MQLLRRADIVAPQMASRKEQKEQARAARVAQEQDSCGSGPAHAPCPDLRRRDRDRGDRDRCGGCDLKRRRWQHHQQGSVCGRQETALRNPPERHGARRPFGQGHDDLLRGPRVPDLQGLHSQPRLLRPVHQDDVATGKVKVDYRSFCTATCNNHPQSVFNQQQVAAYAAASRSCSGITRSSSTTSNRTRPSATSTPPG